MHRLDYICITDNSHSTQHTFQNQMNLKYTICTKFQALKKRYLLTHYF